MARMLKRLVLAVDNNRPPLERLRSWPHFEAQCTLTKDAAVREARKEGVTWLEIGRALQMTESAARRRFIHCDYGNGGRAA